MFIDLPTLVTTEVPRILQEGTSQSSGPLEASRVLGAINQAYCEMTQEAQNRDNGRPELIRYINCSIDDITSRRIDVTIPMKMGRIISFAPRVGEVPTTEEYNGIFVQRQAGSGAQSGVKAVRYEQRGNRLYVIDASFTTASSQFRLWYTVNVPRLHYGVVSANQSGAADGYLALSNTPNVGTYDYIKGIYEGSLAYIYQGVGIGTFLRIENVNESNRLALCQDVDTGERIEFSSPLTTATRYCLLPWFPTQFYTLLAMRAAAKFGKLDGARMLEGYAEQMEAWKTWLVVDRTAGLPIPRRYGSDMGLNMGGVFGGIVGMRLG